MYNKAENKETYLGLQLPISSANIDETGLMLSERSRYTARTEIAIISAANSNLDGTGTIVDLIAGAAVYGTIIKRIVFKAQGTTTQGMIRIFHKDAGGTTRLLREIEVPAVTPANDVPTWSFELNEIFYLKNSTTVKLRVSTEKAETFIVTVEGLNYTYLQ
ncbi:MAG: hypothetical protein HY951_14430 [Bacteroidia bacterium]|nr:hypothetical protein [Bacteroidia bacterium]